MRATIRPISGSFLLFNLFTYNFVNILYATFMAVLVYFVHYIHGVALILYFVRYIHGYMNSSPRNQKVATANKTLAAREERADELGEFFWSVKLHWKLVWFDFFKFNWS